MLDLKELRFYRAIAEHGSFSKAASYLRIAQPALSRHIQKLEHSLGVQLLRRSSRGVVPTAAGEVLLRRTVDLEHDLSLIQREISSYAANAVGSLNIAAMFPLSVGMLPNVVRAYRQAYPGVTLHIVQGYSGDLTEGLLGKKIDMAIVDTPSHPHVELATFPLWAEDVHLFGSAEFERDNPVFAQDTVAFADLADKPIVISSQISAFRKKVDEAFMRHGMRLRPVIEVDGPEMLFEMVRAGIGYGLMPRCGFDDRVASGKLLAVPIDPPLKRRISIVTRAELLGDRLIEPFLDLVRQGVRELAGTEPFRTVTLLFDEYTTFTIEGRALPG